ncbi:hypothetical protein [Thermodesulfovibrio aggregans]|uniref:hypothetical protein n=1 Tax=Thermodesulfovibrio aggregans TaxID=86166 RepID=UPI000743FB82|nr:hypothetical protein [Thermodesulfovibrio aggregans]
MVLSPLKATAFMMFSPFRSFTVYVLKIDFSPAFGVIFIPLALSTRTAVSLRYSLMSPIPEPVSVSFTVTFISSLSVVNFQ